MTYDSFPKALYMPNWGTTSSIKLRHEDSRSSLRHEDFPPVDDKSVYCIQYTYIYIYRIYSIPYGIIHIYILYAYTYCTPNMKATLMLTTFWHGYVDLAGFPSLVLAGEDGYKINILAQNTPSFWLGVKQCSKCMVIWQSMFPYHPLWGCTMMYPVFTVWSVCTDWLRDVKGYCK